MREEKEKAGVWNYFEYYPDKGKSKCLVNEKGKECGAEITGKNPTNLKTHFAKVHPKAYADFSKEEEGRQVLKKAKLSNKDGGNSVTSVEGTQTLRDFLNKKGSAGKWPEDSKEYRDRINAVHSWVIASSCPMNQVDLPEFKAMLNVCDKKFYVPCKYYYFL